MERIWILLTGILMLFAQVKADDLPSVADLPVEPTPMVTMNMRQVPLLDILQELEKQTGIFFSYESSMLNEFPKVSFKAQDESLTYCLRRLFSTLPVTYRMTGQIVILKRKPRLYTISGFVRDSVSYESLINASVFERNTKSGTTTNNYGFYSITLPPGKVTLHASFVGYEAKEVSLELSGDTLIDIPLQSVSVLGEVVVEGLNPRSDVLSTRTGVMEVSSRRIKSMPALLGETDVVKTLQRLPGVAVGTEGMTGLHVRGGNADGNLFLLDGNPVYHTNHLLGFFSAFNPDAVKKTTFYKGSFPAEYGGRLSSVVDVRTNDGDRYEYHGNLSIGLLAMRGNLEGPIIKGKSSFNVSVRRTWMELFTWPILQAINNGESNKIKGGYHFFDMNAKVNHSFSDRTRLYLSFYMGSDSYLTGKEFGYGDGLGKDFRWRWGNLIGSAGINHVFSNKLFASFMAGYSRYRSHIIQDKSDWAQSSLEENRRVFNQESHYRSAMEDVSLRASFDYRWHEKHRLRFGSDYLFHNFRPEQNMMKSWYKDSLKSQATNTIYANSLIHGHEMSLYAEEEMHVIERLKANVGLRYTLFYVQGQAYQSLQPRLSVRYLLGRNISAKVSYTKMNQYIHLLSNSSVSQPTDIWVPVTRKIRPMNAHQYTVGLYHTLNRQYNFSLEGYYKRMNNLIEYKDRFPVGTDYFNWEERVGEGYGRAYGLEVMAEKKTGRLSGWIGYTLSWSDRLFPDGSVNKGRRYPSKYDNRHKIDAVATYRVSRKVELTAAWMFASGNYITIKDQLYMGGTGQTGNGYLHREDLISNGGGFDSAASSRNNYQLAPYHRLDLGINFYRYNKKGRTGIWNLSLSNAYCHPNPFSVEPVYYNNYETGKREVYLRQSILFLFLPSASYTYKF